MSTIFMIVGSIVSIINIFWLFFWRKRIREEDMKYKNFEIDYKRRLDKNKREIEKENQNYIRKLNDKNELLDSLERYTKLSYSALMNSIAMLYKLKVNFEDINNKSSKIDKDMLLEIIEEHYKLKEELHVLKKDNAILYATFGEKDSAIIIGKAYNELYFLNNFIEVQILNCVNGIKVSNDKIIKNIDRAIECSDELRQILDQLQYFLLVKLNEFYPSIEISGPTFIKGTELFEWYYPEYPFEIKGFRYK